MSKLALFGFKFLTEKRDRAVKRAIKKLLLALARALAGVCASANVCAGV